MIYATFHLSGKKEKGLLLKENSKTVLVQLIPNYRGKRKRHKEKHNVKIYPENINPILKD